MAGVPAATTWSSRPQRCSWTTAPRISAWVERVSVPVGLRSSTSTSSPARARSIAVAAPAAREPTMTTSWWEWSVDMVWSRSVDGRQRPPGGDVVGEEGGVVTDAVDEVGVAAVLEAQAEGVQAVDRGDPPAVDDLAAGVEHRDVQPGVGPAVTGGPDDGADAAPAEVDRRGGGRRRQAAGANSLEHLALEVSGFDVLVDLAEQAPHASIGGRSGGRQVVGELGAFAVELDEPADQLHATLRQRRQVDVAPVRGTDELHGALGAGTELVCDDVVGPRPGPELLEPPPDVHAAIAARHATVPTDGEHDVATGAGQFV